LHAYKEFDIKVRTQYLSNLKRYFLVLRRKEVYESICGPGMGRSATIFTSKQAGISYTRRQRIFYYLLKTEEKECNLTVVLQSDNTAKAFQFVYGMESKSPPREIMDIVRAAFNLETKQKDKS
jgi:hypothetical protein